MPQRADDTSSLSPAAQLAGFIDKFEPTLARHIRAARTAMRKRFPTALELVYDNYNFFVIGYGPTERPSDCGLSLAANAGGLRLCFMQGASLPDPDGLLEGAGKQNRYLMLPDIDTLRSPPVEALLAAEIHRNPFPERGEGKLIIRSVSAKQQPRQKTTGK